MKPYLKGPETKRLELGAITSADAEAFYRLNSHPEVMQLTGEPPLQSLEEAEKAIIDYPDFDEVGYGRWGCVLKGEKGMIGFCGLKYIASLDEVDLGYRFLPEYWGKGYATEASNASVRFGFEVLGLESIIAMVLPENLASIRVLEKVGLQREGVVDYEGLKPIRYGIRNSKSSRGDS